MTLSRMLLPALLLVSGAALAASQTVVLEVPGMNCSACPLTVKTALGKVPGVEKVLVTYEPKEAVVTYDDHRTSVEKLRAATRDAGYPSTPKPAK